MRLQSTQNPKNRASFVESLQKGPGSGPYVLDPVACFRDVPVLLEMPFQERTLTLFHRLLGEELTWDELKGPVQAAFPEAPPVIKLRDRLHIAELFHGPTLTAFDYPARFFANLWQRVHQNPATLLVSSDEPGLALASAFDVCQDARVIVLSPSQGLSSLQTKILGTLKNSQIFAVEGGLEQCQALVATCLSENRGSLLETTSANICWPLAQIPLFFESVSRLIAAEIREAPLFSLHCPPYSALYAGLLAKEMGLPIKGFVAARQLALHGQTDEESLMQLALESPNGGQLLHAFKQDQSALKKGIRWSFIPDQAARQATWELHHDGYLPEPSIVAAFHCLEKHRGLSETGVAFAPAHPYAIHDTLEKRMNLKVEPPLSLQSLPDRPLERKLLADLNGLEALL